MKRVKALWVGIVNAGTHGLTPYDYRLGVCKGINLLSLWIFLINITVGPLFFIVSKKISVLFGSLAEASVVACLIVLNQTRRYLTASFTFYLILNIATLYFSSILGPTVEAQLMIVLLVGLTFFMFQSFTVRSLCILSSILVLIVMEVNFKLKIIKGVETTEHIRDLMRWAAYTVIIFLVAILFYLYAWHTTKLLEQIKEHAKGVETKLNEEVQINNKKSKFIRNAYHEVRSQFRAVFMIINVLNLRHKDEKLNDSDVSESLEALSIGSRNLQMILTNILEYSKFEADIKDRVLYEFINVRSMIGDLVEMNKYPADERNIKIDLIVAKEIPQYIESDRMKLTQIVVNLLNNAIKFADRSTTISVIIDKEWDRVRFSVKDQGKGIAKDQLKYIFEPFATERNISSNTEGVGLGLYIVEQLVHQLQGEIRVSSEIGEGSCFIFYLNIAAPSEEPVFTELTRMQK